MSHWERNARYVEETFGVFVDWEERFYNCPYCGEPVYESDWDKENFQDYLCPICEDIDAEEEDYLYYKMEQIEKDNLQEWQTYEEIHRECEELNNCDYETGFDPYLECFTDDC